MKKKIVVVGEADEIGGYKLAGITKAYDLKMEGLADKLIEEDAIIFITKEASKKLQDRMEKIRSKNIVQEIPSDLAGYTRVTDIIRDTVGFDLK